MYGHGPLRLAFIPRDLKLNPKTPKSKVSLGVHPLNLSGSIIIKNGRNVNGSNNSDNCYDGNYRNSNKVLKPLFYDGTISKSV